MSTSAVLAEKPLGKRRRWTYDEVRAEIEETNRSCELWHGRLIRSPSPTPFHQVVSQRLEDALRKWVDRRKLGYVFHAPLDVVLAADLVLQPDVLFIARAHRGIIKSYIDGAPDLVMEVVSLDRPRRDYKEKKDCYEAAGVGEYWIVDPGQKRIEIWSLRDDFHQLAVACTGPEFATSVLLSGFRVRADRILAQRW